MGALPQQVNLLPGPVVGSADLATTATGMEYLGGAVIPAPNPVGVLDAVISPRDSLMIVVQWPQVTVPGTGGGVCQIQFGGAAAFDGGANYWSNPFTSGDFAGIATFGGTTVVSQTNIALNTGVTSADAGHFVLFVSNRAATTKTVNWNGTVGSGAQGTVPTVVTGAAEWVNTTLQIAQVRAVQTGGGFYPGTSLQVFGRNFP